MKYEVTIPFAGEVRMQIEADSPEDAIQAGKRTVYDHLTVDVLDSDEDLGTEVSWEVYDKLLEGMVCNIDTATEASAVESEEEDAQ